MYVYASGPTGSFTTGNSTNTTRNDNNIVTSNTPGTRGYAVFDLTTMPATAIVNNVDLFYNMAVVSPGGGFGWNTRGYTGDLSTITAAGALYTTMGLAPTIWTTAYPTTPGNYSFASIPAAVTFIDTNIGRKVSFIWNTNSSRTYTITGESGTTTRTGTHAPYLAITYNCADITSISAGGPAVAPCPNTAFALSGTATGSIASYLWNGPSGFTSTMANPTVSSGLPATGGYTLTVTDVNGCTARAFTTVNVTPAPSSAVSALTAVAFCDGGSATLSAVMPGMDYQWYDGGTAIAGATDQTYETFGSGEYTVEVSDPATTCSSISSTPARTVMLSNPDVTPADSVLLCTGSVGTLTVNTNGVTTGITFQWQKNGANIPGAGGASYTVSESGIYHCVLNVPANSCNTTSKDVKVVVNEYPIPTVSYSGAMLSTPAIYSHYQWFLNTVAIPGATNATYAPTANGSYRVRVTDAAGCIAYSTGYSVNTVSVANITGSDISLYPNPVSNVLKIAATGTVKAVVSTIEGKVLLSQDAAVSIDFSSFPSGMYIVTIYSADGQRRLIEKVTKQ
ncbi:hypothetical protein GCM10023093_01270 [Nemorincola caseinilytica]|uniref:Ig-like domain-containing protein n=1 Tax=Nemorincola caseinilytica TaxID=2054315 RepID=A0ABP8N475_9BACT